MVFPINRLVRQTVRNADRFFFFFVEALGEVLTFAYFVHPGNQNKENSQTNEKMNQFQTVLALTSTKAVDQI